MLSVIIILYATQYTVISRAMSNIFNLSSSIDERGKTKLKHTCFRYRGESTARVVVIRKLLVVHTTKADDVCATNGVEKKRRSNSRVGKRYRHTAMVVKKKTKQNQDGLRLKKLNFLYNIIYLSFFFFIIAYLLPCSNFT